MFYTKPRICNVLTQHSCFLHGSYSSPDRFCLLLFIDLNEIVGLQLLTFAHPSKLCQLEPITVKSLQEQKDWSETKSVQLENKNPFLMYKAIVLLLNPRVLELKIIKAENSLVKRRIHGSSSYGKSSCNHNRRPSHCHHHVDKNTSFQCNLFCLSTYFDQTHSSANHNIAHDNNNKKKIIQTFHFSIIYSHTLSSMLRIKEQMISFR